MGTYSPYNMISLSKERGFIFQLVVGTARFEFSYYYNYAFIIKVSLLFNKGYYSKSMDVILDNDPHQTPMTLSCKTAQGGTILKGDKRENLGYSSRSHFCGVHEILFLLSKYYFQF